MVSKLRRVKLRRMIAANLIKSLFSSTIRVSMFKLLPRVLNRSKFKENTCHRTRFSPQLVGVTVDNFAELKSVDPADAYNAVECNSLSFLNVIAQGGIFEKKKGPRPESVDCTPPEFIVPSCKDRPIVA